MAPLRIVAVALVLLGVFCAAACHQAARRQDDAAATPCPPPAAPADRLSHPARARLDASLRAASAHPTHVWRDVPPVNADGTVNVYVEIARGSLDKWEFDIAQNRRVLDRVVPSALGGYPTGYGFVPGTIGVDGDPFDGLVVGPPAPAGAVVRGYVLGFMHMTDEKGSDGKVVVTSEPDPDVRRTLLDDAAQGRIAAFFNRYKAVDDDAETFACVAGWSDEAEARRHVTAAARLFEAARAQQ
jgi:inorganic pyrophosphatase